MRAATTPKASASTKGCLAGCLSLLLMVLAPVALAGVGLSMQHVQQRYYADLPAKAQAQRPLYQDALASPNGDWPNEQPSAADQYQTFAYENGAYHLRGVDDQSTIFAWGTPSYGDAAVEVTASERQQNNDDGIGILLDATPGNDEFVTFFVDSGGYWWLDRYHYTASDSDASWDGIGYGQSNAINVGPTATNHLLVIHRGAEFLCYVNGVFLGLYIDDAAPRVGHMGVFLDSADTEGIFSNFAVYPAPS